MNEPNFAETALAAFRLPTADAKLLFETKNREFLRALEVIFNVRWPMETTPPTPDGRIYQKPSATVRITSDGKTLWVTAVSESTSILATLFNDNNTWSAIPAPVMQSNKHVCLVGGYEVRLLSALRQLVWMRFLKEAGLFTLKPKVPAPPPPIEFAEPTA